MSTTSSSLPPPPPNPRFDTLPPPPLPSSSSATTTHQRTDSQSSSAAPIQDALARDFPEVASLSREDMQQLLDDPDYFDAFFHTQIPQAVELDEAVSHQIQQNLELALKSQELKPALEDLRRETKELFDQALELQTRSHYLAEAQRETYRRFSQDAQLNRYRAATTLQDHLCESLLQSLLDGQFANSEQLDEQFIKQYKEVRKVYHKRSMGLRKWEEGKVVWET
ncbi:vacuolar protein sorting family 37 protein [Sporobolomyces salmoneus]|uniref:vacuolar protein sorting family 37 protein n=1 Tax=Sporobolomyces salmoneus TaxID=183962 RepID=UPI00317A0FA3